MVQRLRLILSVLLVILIIATPAGAWSFKEHILVTRLAVQRLLADPETPEEMKAWLREIAPTAGDLASARKLLVEDYIGPEPVGLEKLDWWVCYPDLARKLEGNKPVEPFGVPEAPMHFIDLELLMPGDGVKQYRHDLSNKAKLDDLPRDWSDPRLVQAGYLPWRVEQVYNDLVKAIREKRLAPRDANDRDNALVFAGFLAHYLADNTQPQHATIDYRSRAYFAIGQRAPDVHGMFEWGMLDWEGHPFPELREELWRQLTAHLDVAGDPATRGADDGEPLLVYGGDPWKSTAGISLAAYDALPLIGLAAQAASGQAIEEGDPMRPVGAPMRPPEEFDIPAFFQFRGEVAGQEMTLLDFKAQQLSLATRRIEAMLRQAWKEAQAPAAR